MRMQREIRVGLLILLALVLTIVGVFSVGEKNNLFVRKNVYVIRFATVGGLATGNPVQLNGVTVGRVEAVVLPEAIEETLLTVEVAIDRRYSRRVRADSVAKIRTLGLLGDKYVEITSGTAAAELIPSGGEIPAAVASDMDSLIATSGDLMENVVAVSLSLRNILARVERGEGLLGTLLLDTEGSEETRTSFQSLVQSFDRLAKRIESGEGTFGRLLTSDRLARELESSVSRLDSVLEKIEGGDGALSVLLNDPQGGDSVRRTLDSLSTASEELTALSEDLRDAKGLLPQLLHDETFGNDIRVQLHEMIRNLNLISVKLNEGDGSLSMLLNDPGLYEAIDDILIGVDDSKMLRWLVRNQQKEGIERRYREQQQAPDPGSQALSPTPEGDSP